MPKHMKNRKKEKFWSTWNISKFQTLIVSKLTRIKAVSPLRSVELSGAFNRNNLVASSKSPCSLITIKTVASCSVNRASRLGWALESIRCTSSRAFCRCASLTVRKPSPIDSVVTARRPLAALELFTLAAIEAVAVGAIEPATRLAADEVPLGGFIVFAFGS